MSQSFRTIVRAAKPPFTITHLERIMTIGSCFSENVGRYFERYKFPIVINPFGQQYNPYSISNAIRRLLSPEPYTESDLIEQDGLYHSYDHHGSFSRQSKVDTLDNINVSLQTAAEALKQTSVLFLTFGTAHSFRLKESGNVVSNCHKVPASQFDFELMEVDEIVTELEKSITALWAVNPALKVVLTVSPVRYFAFGHFENSVSKGHLFAAIHKLIAKCPQLYYFPAYELVMDDLRDYRFFADDMLHPTAQATEYVWEAMAETLFSAATQQLIKQVDDIASAAHHRPRDPHGEGHRKFVQQTLQKMDKMQQQYGFDFGKERQLLDPDGLAG